MTTQLNEQWAQGSQPGDPPISSQTVPIPAREVQRRAIRARLRALNNSSGLPEVRQAVLDIRAYLKI